MAFLGGLLGHRDANVTAVRPMSTAAGAQAIAGQLQQGGEMASRQAAGLAGARGSTALNRMGAQQMGSSAITQAGQQAGIARQQLEQARLQQGFDASMAAQKYNQGISEQNAKITGGLGMAAGTMLMGMSDMRAKTDARPMPGWLSRGMTGADAPEMGPTPALQSALQGYAPEQTPPDRARELDQSLRMGLLDFGDLDEEDRTLLTRYQMADIDRRNQEAQGMPAMSGALHRTREPEYQPPPSDFDRGYRSMTDQLAGRMGPMKPIQFRYRDGAAAQMGTDTAPRMGVSAQDMAKSPLYQSSVVERPDGMLAVDPMRAQQATMAGVSDLHQRLRMLENSPPEEQERLGKHFASRDAGGEAYPVRIQREDSGPGRHYGEGFIPPDESAFDRSQRFDRNWSER